MRAWHYADAVPSSEADDAESLAMSHCEEFAIIGYWKLTEDDTFKCYRSSDVLDPNKRMIRKCEETEMFQVLYSSHHTKEVFLFHKGYSSSDSGKKEMQCLVLNL